MNNSENIEAIGVLLKEETLQNLDHPAIDNTFVMESLEPFPGYHGDLPTDPKPGFLYFITEKDYPTEHIFRITQRLCRYQQIHPDVCPASLFIHNVWYHGIRVRDLDNYDLIEKVLGCLRDEQLHFAKSRTLCAAGLIRVDKVFCLEKIDNYCFRDLEDEFMYYLEIPFHFTWNLFKSVTYAVKNNLDNRNFDAALGFIYRKNIFDFIRIYAKNPSTERLQAIRSKYLEEIARVQMK